LTVSALIPANTYYLRVASLNRNGAPNYRVIPATQTPAAANFTWDADRRQVYGILPDPDGAGAHPRPAFKNTYDAVGRDTVFNNIATRIGAIPTGA